MSNIILMGILNTSPESFFDGKSVSNNIDDNIKKAEQILQAGAQIIDIGGQSTKPNFKVISVKEELKRTIPLIEAILQKFKTIISIDTYKYEVAKSAMLVGANIVNDISSLADINIAKLVAKEKKKLVIMHQGKAESLEAVKNFFDSKIKEVQNLGIEKENLILDIGLGFGKTIKENWFLLENIKTFSCYNLPILVGASRKRFTGKTLEKSLYALQLAKEGLSKTNIPLILRVHDVKESKEFLGL